MTLRLCPKCGLHFSSGEMFCPRDGRMLEKDEPDGARSPRKIVDEGALIGGRYRIVRELGSGAMGTVYLATQETLRREVAVKFLHPELSRELDEVRRFLVEARAAGRVDHPNVVAVFDFGRDPKGHYFLVMEYAVGHLLSDVIESQSALPQERVIHILHQIVLAAAMAHRQNINHRDLKPQNIILTQRRRDHHFVKVLDFGIAKILGDEGRTGPITQGFALGTPEYMAPEQIEAKPLDLRCDLYAIGIVAYEMLTGEIPFGGEVEEVFEGHLHREPRPIRELCPDLHPDLELLVATLMAKQPENRFSRAEAVLNVLTRIEEELEKAARVQPIPETLVVADKPHAEPQSAAFTPTTFQVLSATTPWETPGLITEIGRLAKLWERRVAEVADILWGQDSRPPQVLQWQASIEEGERRITDIETRIAVLRDEVETLDADYRKETAALRMKRLDLVARQGSVWALLEDAQSLDSDVEADSMDDVGADTVRSVQLEDLGFFPSDEEDDDTATERQSRDTHKEKTRPEIVEDSIPTLLTDGSLDIPEDELDVTDERLSTSVDFALPDDFDEQLGRPSDTLLSEPSDLLALDESLELIDKGTDLREAQHALIALERKIAVLDTRLGKLMDEQKRAVLEKERAIMSEVELVNEERAKLAPLYRELAAFVGRNADRRPELGEHIAAVKSVARAIRHYQLVLQTVESS